MEYRPYLYGQREWPFKLIYNHYQGKYFSKGDECEQLLSVRGDEIVVRGMWRMQLIGELHSDLWAPSYDGYTNREYYDEAKWQQKTEEEMAEFRRENSQTDTYAEYFEALASVAVEIGCERAEIKCLIKSLVMRYRTYRMSVIADFPHEAFAKLYTRLVSSNDMEQLRVAERLGRLHVLNLEWFMWCNIQNEMMRQERVAT